jgi:Ser/Thr protein kinase RdoA (MazF antagonist)
VLADGTNVVLRRYVWRALLDDEPELPHREVDALNFATAHGLAVPALLAADTDGTLIGDDIPAIVMSFVPGKPLAVPDLSALASVALTVHDIDAARFPHRYYPWYRDALTDPPPEATDQTLWRRAIDIWHHEMPDIGHGLIHRDFHPGNVLWHRKSPHVVDWTAACAGPWGCDIAHCRDNLIHLADFDVADRFLHYYLSMIDHDYDPYWEIASVLEHAPTSFDTRRIAVSEQRLIPAVAAYG